MTDSMKEITFFKRDLALKKKEDQKAMSAKRKKNHQNTTQTQPFFLKKIKPLNSKQEDAFDAYDDGKNLLLHGVAGTGKTLLALYLSLDELSRTNKYKKLLIIRSVVPSRDMGFLPGNEKEKSAAYEDPYKAICTELYDRGDAYEILTNKGDVEFTTTSFLRGMNFHDTIVFLDEVQNLSGGEFNTVMTRIGENSRVIVAGDYRQSDFVDTGINNSIRASLNVLRSLPSVIDVEFGVNEIVRSGFCKEWILAHWKE